MRRQAAAPVIATVAQVARKFVRRRRRGQAMIYASGSRTETAVSLSGSEENRISP
jgi:hypothetical protein